MTDGLEIIQKGAAAGNWRAGRVLPPLVKLDMVVIHLMDGSIASCDNWFNHPAANVSAHYGVSKTGEIHQYVQEEDTAFHAGRVFNPSASLVTLRPGLNPNLYSIGIEHEGKDGDVFTDEQYAATAHLIAAASLRWGFDIDATHIVRHRDVFAKKSCPGTGCDISRIILEAQQTRDRMTT